MMGKMLEQCVKDAQDIVNTVVVIKNETIVSCHGAQLLLLRMQSLYLAG